MIKPWPTPENLKIDSASCLDPEEYMAYNREAIESFDIWNARRTAKIEKLNRAIMELSMMRDALLVSSWPGGLRRDESTDHQL